SHKAAHPRQLTDLLPVATRTGVDHQPYRVVFVLALVVLQGLQHDVGDLVGAMGPDVDDFVVAFTRGNDATTVLFLDLGDLLLSRFNLVCLLLRDDHIVDPNGNSRPRRFKEPELLQLIQRSDGLLVTAELIAVPNQFTDLPLADDLIRKTQLS